MISFLPSVLSRLPTPSLASATGGMLGRGSEPIIGAQASILRQGWHPDLRGKLAEGGVGLWGQGRDDGGDNLGEVPTVHQACAECITGVTSHSHAVTNRDYCAHFSE